MRGRRGIMAMKRGLQTGVALGNIFALVACGGYGTGVPKPLISSSGTYFKTVTLQSSKPPQLTGSQSAFRRRFADACVPATNLTLSGANDVNDAVVGISNEDSMNVSWSDDSTGYANYITSPIAGGYNIADVQANVSARGYLNGLANGVTTGVVNIMQSIVVTTYGNDIVSAGQTVSGVPANLSIINNGMAMQNIPLNTPIALSHGEVVEWTGTVLTETVTDAAAGSTIAMTASYYPVYDATYPGEYPGNPPYMDISVTGTNVLLGGALVTTALADDPGVPGTPCPTPSPAPTSSASPASSASMMPQPTSTPTATPSPTPSCLLPSGTPNPHPTQDTNVGGCTS
jgi:hypothetical protein